MFAKPSEDCSGRDVPAACVHRYLVYGIVVESEFRLNSVDEVTEANAEASIRISFGSDTFRQRARGLPADPDDWIQHVVLPDGGVYMKLDGISKLSSLPTGAPSSARGSAMPTNGRSRQIC